MTVSAAIELTSAVVVVLAVFAGLLALVVTRRPLVALSILLEFLIGAGLLHLAADPTFTRAASAAVVLAVRRLITWSLTNGAKALAPPVQDWLGRRNNQP
jgi:hypothetical protein